MSSPTLNYIVKSEEVSMSVLTFVLADKGLRAFTSVWNELHQQGLILNPQNLDTLLEDWKTSDIYTQVEQSELRKLLSLLSKTLTTYPPQPNKIDDLAALIRTSLPYLELAGDKIHLTKQSEAILRSLFNTYCRWKGIQAPDLMGSVQELNWVFTSGHISFHLMPYLLRQKVAFENYRSKENYLNHVLLQTLLEHPNYLHALTPFVINKDELAQLLYLTASNADEKNEINCCLDLIDQLQIELPPALLLSTLTNLAQKRPPHRCSPSLWSNISTLASWSFNHLPAQQQSEHLCRLQTFYPNMSLHEITRFVQPTTLELLAG